jgi:DNA-binding PadR family transcriptional regulator
MHPYEVASTLRHREKHESIRLNYGSLYSVVESLARRGLIEPKETEREGRLPERTVYGLTEAGREEYLDWLSEILSTPAKEYPTFEAALSFMPALPPEEALKLLQARALRLEVKLAGWHGAREVVEKRGLPRLLWVESEFEAALAEAELNYVRKLCSDIQSGALDGLEFWRRIHDGSGEGPPDLPAEWS